MSVKLKNVILGQGKTKVCLPIIAMTREAILKEARDMRELSADIIEWRADFYEDVMSLENVLQTIEEMADILDDKPILFTFRTKAEGGEKYIDTLYYKMLLGAVMKQGKVAAVDVELFIGEGILEDMVQKAKAYDCVVIASNHDFDKTPDKDEIVSRLISMKEKGADVSKIAVMPRCSKDVLTLLCATEEAKRSCEDITLITMSMGQLGVISRICGGVFGSAMTFGAKTKELASAPGQVEVTELQAILSVVEEV